MTDQIHSYAFKLHSKFVYSVQCLTCTKIHCKLKVVFCLPFLIFGIVLNLFHVKDDLDWMQPSFLTDTKVFFKLLHVTFTTCIPFHTKKH